MNYKLHLSLMTLISVFICWLLPSSVWAAVQVDGIYYDLNTSAKTATVTSNPDKYIGTISIPASFDYEGTTYNVTSIGYCAFLDCNGMTEIYMPSSLTSIANSAFERCKGLTDLTIGKGVTTIGTEAFHNCINLTRLTLSSSLKTIGDAVFAGCSNLSEIIAERTTAPTIQSSTFTGVDKSTCVVYVPAGCRSAYANSSYWNAFSNIKERTVLASGTCGNNVTYTIYYDMSMVIAGTGAMKDNVKFGSEYYQQIKSVVIEDGVTYIGQFAFSDFISLTSVRLSNSVNSIGNAAFYGCTHLTSVNLPNSLTSFGNAVFYNCSSLASIEIPSSIAILNYGLFYGCTSLTSISIPEGVTTIGDAVFNSCTSLASVVIPSSVTSIGNSVFDGCESLSSISVDAGNTIYDSRDDSNAIIETSTNDLIFGCMNTVIPDGVISIGDYAFYACKGLTSVTIPSSVTSVGSFAFYYCTALTSLTLPTSLASIDDYAFCNCSGLTSITVENATPLDINSNVFVNVDKAACTLYVPAGSKSAYEEAQGWNEFQNIEEYGEIPDPNVDTDISALDNAIYVEQVEGRIGGTMDISVKLKNSYPVLGFQFTLELPEGTTINSWALSSERLPSGATTSDKISTESIEGNKITVACSLNYDNATFTGNDGEIATVNVTFSEDMEVGSYPIYLTACDVTDESAADEDLSNIKATLILEDYLLGDANGDGKVRIGDATAILNYIVGRVSETFNEKAADANCDGKIRIGDATAVLNIIVAQ